MSRIRMRGLRRITKGHTKSTPYIPCCIVKTQVLNYPTKSPGSNLLKIKSYKRLNRGKNLEKRWKKARTVKDWL